MLTGLKNQTLIDLFSGSLARPELMEKDYLQVVTSTRREKLTFGRLWQSARNLAADLIEKKCIKPGDKIAILGDNRADWDITFWAIVLAGAVPVLIDPQRRVEGVKKHLSNTDAKILIMAEDYQDKSARQNLRHFLVQQGKYSLEMSADYSAMQDSSRIAALLARVRSKIKARQTAVIICTSGTTGDPREVEMTHTNLITNIQGVLSEIKVSAADRLGHIIPPHHSFGLTITKLMTFAVGATNIYTNQYRQVPNLIKTKGITIFIAIPALYTVMAKKIEDELAKYKKQKLLLGLVDRLFPALTERLLMHKLGWQNLRFFLSGAAHLPEWVLHSFWKRNIRLYNGYGLTESSPAYGFNTDPKKLGSVGKPIPTLEVKIIDDNNNCLKAGRQGQIILGGPCIVKGYYKNPKATRQIIKTDTEGTRWLYTGDLGYLDEDGCLYITGRKKYIIVLPNGKNVNPEIVESALSKAEYVDELLVVPSSSAIAEPQSVQAIVKPAWEQLQDRTNLSYDDLVKQPEMLKDILWESINKTQQTDCTLASFEKIRSKNDLNIQMKEFQKTSTGKIKRDEYI
jgi:long-chain acyl-CoA synthetase